MRYSPVRFAAALALVLPGLSSHALAETEPSVATGKNPNEMSFSYAISIPTAGTRDFISNASFVGFGFDWAHYLNDRFSLGVSFRWSRFAESDDRQTYTFTNGAITGEQDKVINAYPMYARAKMDIPASEDKSLVPYIALNLGPIYAQRYRSVGFYEFDTFGWQFAIAPEIGLYKNVARTDTGAILSIRYDAGFGTDEIPAFSALSFAIGIRQELP